MVAPLVSIIINNYNYADFLAAAIESALGQSYTPVEVLVVDDGSTDSSRQIIARYGSRILPVLKTNGGQASAFNFGIAASHGEIICFLDSDDLFHRDKVKEVVGIFEGVEDTSKPLFVSHRLELVDAWGVARAGLLGGKSNGPLNLYTYAKRYGFTYPPSGPTTGISLNRVLARRIFPIPEGGLKVGADDFVRRAASLIADCHAIGKVLGRYRVHENNRWHGTADEKIGPAEHIEQLERYLNNLLVENNLEPVISFRNSMYYCVYLAEKGQWSALSKHVVRAFLRHPDLHTVRFMYLLARNVFRKDGREPSERAQIN
jgi:glycosyltransferase involved in cell wall biosynthesis